MSTRISDELATLDHFAENHPTLLKLARDSEFGPEIHNASRVLARHLAGVPSDEDSPLASLWLTLAHDEFEVLASLCHRQPLRAVAATVAVVSRLVAQYEEPSKPDVRHEAESDGDHVDPEDVREQLANLLGRRLPEGFPNPTAFACEPDEDEAEFGARLGKHLDISADGVEGLKAIHAVGEAVEALSGMLPGLGWDYSIGTLHRTLLAKIERLYTLAQKSRTLREMADALGRLESQAKAVRKSVQGGRGCVSGVRVGGELHDVLPCELALLGDETTEELFFQRYIDRRLLCLELAGSTEELSQESVARGPVIACVDTSGSMAGAPEIAAKALILAVTRQALEQGRAVHLMLFGGPGEFTDIELGRGRNSIGRLLDFLCMGFHAGTDFDGPLLRALQVLDKPDFEKADILVITDGLCRASRRVTDHVASARQKYDVRVVTVLIGHDNRGVRDFSDTVWGIDPSSRWDNNIDIFAFGR